MSSIHLMLRTWYDSQHSSTYQPHTLWLAIWKYSTTLNKQSTGEIYFFLVYQHRIAYVIKIPHSLTIQNTFIFSHKHLGQHSSYSDYTTDWIIWCWFWAGTKNVSLLWNIWTVVGPIQHPIWKVPGTSFSRGKAARAGS